MQTGIADDVLRGREPKLGTITVGRGVAATSRKGGTYSRPRRESTLVFHTDDPQVATAVQTALGGSVYTDSPTWGFDVVTDADEVDVDLLPGGFRQALELWRAAECARRCDGVTMRTLDGKPTDRPCLCEQEMDSGADRSCTPSTVLPVLVRLDVERWGVWQVRSNAWGTADHLKGTIRMLSALGITGGRVPAVLRVATRKVRDTSGQVHEVPELTAVVAASADTVEAIAAGPAALTSGDDARARAVLMGDWQTVLARAQRIGGLVERLRDDFRQAYAGRTPDELSVPELRDWLAIARATVEDAEASAPVIPVCPACEGGTVEVDGTDRRCVKCGQEWTVDEPTSTDSDDAPEPVSA